jgi:glycine cleavage system aminomethyltransferase T
MATTPLEIANDPWGPSHYGSVAAEIAVCTKAAGLVDRSNVTQLAISGPETQLEHVLSSAVPGGAPAPGRASCVAGTWCCRPTARRAIVAGPAGAVTRWRQVTSRAISTAGLAVSVEPLAGAAALSLIGPRSTKIMRAADLPADMAIGEVADSVLAGSRVTVVREDGDHYLLLFEHGHPNTVWQALWEAGHELGLAPVGNQALELLQAARPEARG